MSAFRGVKVHLSNMERHEREIDQPIAVHKNKDGTIIFSSCKHEKTNESNSKTNEINEPHLTGTFFAIEFFLA